MRHDIGVPESFEQGILSGDTIAFFRKNRKEKIETGDLLYIFPEPLKKGMKTIAIREVSFSAPARIYANGMSLWDEDSGVRNNKKMLAKCSGFETWADFLTWFERRFRYGDPILLIVIGREDVLP